jgi:hypothetical protein
MQEPPVHETHATVEPRTQEIPKSKLRADDRHSMQLKQVEKVVSSCKSGVCYWIRMYSNLSKVKTHSVFAAGNLREMNPHALV